VLRDSALPKRLLMPLLPQQGAIADAFDAAIARSGGTSLTFGEHVRALLAPDGDRATYIDKAVGRKKLRELQRQLRRLGESGSLSWEIAQEPAAIDTSPR